MTFFKEIILVFISHYKNEMKLFQPEYLISNRLSPLGQNIFIKNILC